MEQNRAGEMSRKERRAHIIAPTALGAAVDRLNFELQRAYAAGVNVRLELDYDQGQCPKALVAIDNKAIVGPRERISRLQEA